MASFNRVILLGNVTRDPELRYIASGTAVTDLGLAVNEKYKNAAGEWVEEVTFVDVTLWGRTAEVAGEYLSKGSPVFIEGRLKLDKWDSPDGQKRSKLKVVCDRMQLLSGRGGPPGGAPQTAGARPPRSQAPAPSQESGRPDDAYDMPPPEPSGGDNIPF